MSTRLPLGWNKILESLPSSDSVPEVSANSWNAPPSDPSKPFLASLLEDPGYQIPGMALPPSLPNPHFITVSNPCKAHTSGVVL